MKPHFAALAAAPLVACASAGVSAEDQGQAPGAYDPSQVAIYWMGQKPPCGMVRLTEVQAESESGLRWAAVALRGNAVVGVRSRMVVPEASRYAYRRTITGPAAYRVYFGTAVRLDDRCRM
jgi:hypothetical protein